MKVNEFVKKFRIEHIKWILVDADLDFIDVHSSVDGSYRVAVSELKRLVESHDLVEKFGGLEKAKEMKVGDIPLGFVMNTTRLEQAIADVESCQ